MQASIAHTHQSAVWVEDEVRHRAAWYFQNVVWTDICNNILPRTEKKATEQALARKGKKGWMSSGSKLSSWNSLGERESLKQNSWGTLRVYFFPVLARGKLHLVCLGSAFPGETPAGAAQVVTKVRAALNVRFQAGNQPTVVFTDRGQGFFALKTGRITPEYKAALQEDGLRAFMGEDASRQPGDLKELMLHETAMAWVAERLKVTRPAKPWEETEVAFGERLREVAEYINKNHDVTSLCNNFLKRVRALRDAKGDRLRW